MPEPSPAAGRRWTPAEDAVLRTLPPQEAARRLGRTFQAVRPRRFRLKLGRPRRWTAAEDEVVRTRPPAEAAAGTGHPLTAVRRRRVQLRVPAQQVG